MGYYTGSRSIAVTVMRVVYLSVYFLDIVYLRPYGAIRLDHVIQYNYHVVAVPYHVGIIQMQEERASDRFSGYW